MKAKALTPVLSLQHSVGTALCLQRGAAGQNQSQGTQSHPRALQALKLCAVQLQEGAHRHP